MGQFSSALLCLYLTLVVISAPIPRPAPIVSFNNLTIPSQGGTFTQFETISGTQSSESVQILQETEKISQPSHKHHAEEKRGFFSGLEGVLHGFGCSHGDGGGCFIEDPSSKAQGSQDPSSKTQGSQDPPSKVQGSPPAQSIAAQAPPGPPTDHAKGKQSPGHANVVSPL
ncbi:hypothetical protein BU17DRAFT_64009 [Hysterangium stoloniferum]|nr:hypothetical protein BU17DRAFT_64009 [Hysterangium stoloniferum]